MRCRVHRCSVMVFRCMGIGMRVHGARGRWCKGEGVSV